MSRRNGKIRRVLSRLFKERQIYHRSDGVVHFISMSSQTQIALAVVICAALMWVAYSSVNVVFKEQIIVAKEADFTVMQTNLSKRLHDAQKAYDDVNWLNTTLAREFDETMEDVWARHNVLKNMVERKAAIDASLNAQAQGLATAGGPSGQKLKNGNRLLIDVAPGEPTPRQSRHFVLRREAAAEAARHSANNPSEGLSQESLSKMEQAAAELYTEQMLLLASLEEKSIRQIENLRNVLASTGLSQEMFITPAKISNFAIAQGGPFIDPASTDGANSKFFQYANRAAAAVDELSAVEAVVNRLPLSSPLTVSRRMTDGFGIRRDPINGRHASHYGIDFAAPWASPVMATGAGVVKYAGFRGEYGRLVEIDHGNGFITRYAHLSRIVVQTGQKINLHDKVGELGSSGRSTGPHVHYELRYKNRPLNPRRFIEAGRYVFES
jgi:murein DD-endopeptidase MepM/ murein hydrolase activator NlpD